LRDSLLTEVGDDVIAGTLFAVRDQTDEEKAALMKQLKKATEEHMSQSTTSKKNPGSRDHEPAKAVSSFKIGVYGNEFSVPFSSDDACSLHSMLQESPFGIEGLAGVHYDSNVRQSREVDADSKDGVTLPDCLHHPRTLYPELEEQIRTRLAPTAKHIAIKPYKLVVYGPGDFFTRHADATDDPRHFGTLAIHLPCVGDFKDTSNFIDPNFHSYGDSRGEDEGGHHYVFKKVESDSDNDDDDDANQNSKKKSAAATATATKTSAEEEKAFARDDDEDPDEHRALGT